MNDERFRLIQDAPGARPVFAVAQAGLDRWLARRPARQRAWIEAHGFTAKAGEVMTLPGADGRPAAAVLGLGEDVGTAAETWAYAALEAKLPAGDWVLAGRPSAAGATRALLGWMLAAYRFDRYKSERKPGNARLVPPASADTAHCARVADAVWLARDLVNTPAADLGPAELAEAVTAMAKPHKAKVTVVEGEELLAMGWPAVHAVGKGSARAPRLIDLTWGKAGDPKVTLVGKGVCFDSGGLDIKPSSGMLMMKKDMGGAAVLIGLAQAIMAAKLPVRLRLLVPAVENMPSGTAFRPWDVLETRKGIRVEVGNTDAEGRLILCDALAEADRDKPDLLIDCATLTGAARVALGPELPPVFCRQDALWRRLERHAAAADDPVWRMPLWRRYRPMLDSKVADISSTGNSPHAGAITAALFLAEFVDPATAWLHLDLHCWNVKASPGKPEGGEAQALRALLGVVVEVANEKRPVA